MCHTLTRTLAAVLAVTIPFTAMAAAGLQAENSIAGLGLRVGIVGAEAGADISVVLNNPKAQSSTLSAHTDAEGSATLHVPGTKTEKAGTYTISAVDGDRTTVASAQVLIEPDTVDAWTSSVQTRSPYIHADGHDEAEVAVTLRDQYGNILADRPVTLISSRPEDMVEALTPQTDTQGIQHFLVTTDMPGHLQLRAIDLLSGTTIVESAEVEADGPAVGGYETDPYERPADRSGKRFYFNAQVSQSFGVLDHLIVTAPATLNVNEEAQKISVRAVDRDGNTIENYVSTVRFKTTDPDAVVPNFGEYTFKDRDLGEKTFALALKFRTQGEQTLRIEDANDPRVYGEASIQVQSGGGFGDHSIEVTSHKNGDYVNSLNIRIEGRGPRYANLIVMGGKQDTYGATDDTGSFAIDTELNPGQRDFTIRVRDDAGRYDSGSIHLILDDTKPAISTISFVPKEPDEGEKVLVIVESEEHLAQALLRLPNPTSKVVEEVKLAPNPTQSGSYQAFFTAPVTGVYQPAVIVMDRAGNVEEVRTTLTVGSQTLPTVKNLQAQPKVDAVELTWDAVPGDISAYRIYVGEHEEDIFSLSTEKPVTRATIKGLTPGTTYTFSVTATRGELESEQKSAPVEAQALGFKLEVEPEANALHITWTSLSTDLPLSAFLLEYGVDAEDLTEKRMINGELRDVTIRDLLSGTEYVVKVTPITVTGDTLNELAATGKGTPGGSGFKPGPRDDVPFDVVNKPGDTLHSAPNNPASGIPPIAWMTAMFAGVAGVLYRLQRRKSIKQTEEFLSAVQSRYQQ